MKKTIVAMTMSLLLVAMPVVAQTSETSAGAVASAVPQNEVSLCYGRVSVMEVVGYIGGIFGSGFSLGTQVLSGVGTTGAIGVEYYHYFTPHFALGGNLTAESLSISFNKRKTDESGAYIKDENDNYVYEPGGTQTSSLLALMPALKFPWFYKEHVSMYSSLMAGVSMGLGDKPSFGFYGHISPVGIDFGNDQWRGFTELGFGAKGLLNLGLRYNF